MTGVKMQAIIPKRFLREPARLERAIENALDGAAENVKIDFAVTTQTWNHKPIFFIRKKKGERFIGTKNVIYKFVSGGTKRHIIRAKPGHVLAFYASGFRAKTRPLRIASLKGKQANKDLRVVRFVRHPGTKAREFTKVIKEKWDRKLPGILQRAIDSEV